MTSAEAAHAPIAAGGVMPVTQQPCISLLLPTAAGAPANRACLA